MTIFAPPPMSPFPVVREWFLVRDKSMPMMNGRDGYTLGEIRYGILDSQRVCYCCEDEDKHLENGNGKYDSSAIPLGRFLLRLSEHANEIEVKGTPGFSDIAIRKYGGEERLLGCIAVGSQRTLDGVRDSQPALTVLVKELRRLTMNGVAVYLNVTRAE